MQNSPMNNHNLLIVAMTIVFAASGLFSQAYAEEIDYQKYFEKIIDWGSGFGTSTINNTDIDPTYKEKLGDAITTGTPVAKAGINFWVQLHQWIVHMILGNSPIEIGAGIATIIGLGFVGFGVFHFLKKMFKVLVIVAMILIAITIFIVFIGSDWFFFNNLSLM